MDDINSSSLILLTYKGKVLLMHRQKNALDGDKYPWSFIGGIKDKKESFENAMTRTVEKETGIKIGNVEFISEFCYHATLTDDNVNKIQREENQSLDFFTPKELNKLSLSKKTQEFISKHSDVITPNL